MGGFDVHIEISLGLKSFVVLLAFELGGNDRRRFDWSDYLWFYWNFRNYWLRRYFRLCLYWLFNGRRRRNLRKRRETRITERSFVYWHKNFTKRTRE